MRATAGPLASKPKVWSDRVEMEADETVGRAARIVAAYVSHNSLPPAELTGLLAAVHAAFAGLGQEEVPAKPETPRATPAQIRRSITSEALISFEDGKPYKTLRRHLTLRGLTPEAYRVKWGLPGDYPMTAQIYSEKRSALARELGLGRKASEVAAPEPVAATPLEATAPARRGRRKAAQ